MERERRSREYWEQELSEYWDSGLTVQEYSELKELPYESVRRWIRRLKQERPGVAKVDFVEIKAPSVPISTGASVHHSPQHAKQTASAFASGSKMFYHASRQLRQDR